MLTDGAKDVGRLVEATHEGDFGTEEVVIVWVRLELLADGGELVSEGLRAIGVFLFGFVDGHGGGFGGRMGGGFTVCGCMRIVEIFFFFLVWVVLWLGSSAGEKLGG